ncbi:MAG: hypothetical protein WCT50_03635 [Patescibacteria group bacterium]|jgi:hypothetical protein
MKRLLLLLSAITMVMIALIMLTSVPVVQGEKSDITQQITQQSTQLVNTPVQISNIDATALNWNWNENYTTTTTSKGDMLMLSGTKLKENYSMLTTSSGSNLASTNCLQAATKSLSFTTDPQYFAWYDGMMIEMATTNLKNSELALSRVNSLNNMKTIDTGETTQTDAMNQIETTTGLKDGVMAAIDTGTFLNTATTLTNAMNPFDGITDFAMMRPEQATNFSNTTVCISWMNFAAYADAGAFNQTYI